MFEFFQAYDKFIVAIIGWAYGYYLSHKGSSRAEVSRLKDRLTDKLEKILSWYVAEIENASLSAVQIEQILTDKISQCEHRITQFNKYVGVNVIDNFDLIRLRDIDVAACLGSKHVPVDTYSQFADVIEKIECAYDRHYIHQSFVSRLWKEHEPELKGAFFGALAVIVSVYAARCVVGLCF
jgi:hypothetical protein